MPKPAGTVKTQLARLAEHLYGVRGAPTTITPTVAVNSSAAITTTSDLTARSGAATQVIAGDTSTYAGLRFGTANILNLYKNGLVLTTDGLFSAKTVKAAGLTGAVAAARFVGGVASGPPVAGSFLLGDWVVTQDARVYVCTVAGAPGTWVESAATAVAAHVAAADPHGDRAYADGLFASNDAMLFKGVVDCSANPNYPAASAGDLYKISAAGKIGGAAGVNVEIGDTIICSVDGTASDTQAAVGANWYVVQVNIDGAVVGPTSATAGRLATFSGATGKVIADSGIDPATLAPKASPTFTGAVQVPNGAAATPGLTGATTNTGFVFGTNTVDIATNGVSRVRVGAGGNMIPVTDIANSMGASTNRFTLGYLSGGVIANVQTLSANTTIDATYATVIVDATGAARTITLPAAATTPGKRYEIKKKDASANTVTVDGNGAELIDGSATYVIATQYQAVTIVSDGTQWWIV